MTDNRSERIESPTISCRDLVEKLLRDFDYRQARERVAILREALFVIADRVDDLEKAVRSDA
jgi:hypothetical protein